MTREKLENIVATCIHEYPRIGIVAAGKHGADLILSELAKEKPTAPAGLVEELRELAELNSSYNWQGLLKEILSRYEARQ